MEMQRRQPTPGRGLPAEGSGEAARVSRRAEHSTARPDDTSRGGKWNMLMESVVERNNMANALKRVRKNRGAPGIDGMTVDDLTEFLKDNWKRIREELLAGTYIPSPVRRVEIPKPDGGVRMLGIPTVLDRLIQQALLQVMEPIFDPEFSNYSIGFRKYRKAQTAVQVARHHVNSGRRWVVDLDLEKFFDRVNHDILMVRVAPLARCWQTSSWMTWTRN
jgi:RNA-directed DNA polymerase